MAVPRNRHSKARTRSKRAHMAMKPKGLSKCANCGSFRQAHIACLSCGIYSGRVAIEQK